MVGPSTPRPLTPVQTWSQLTQGWLWPRLWDAARLSLRPAHLGLSFFLTVLLLVVGRVGDLWLATAPDGTPNFNRPGILIDRRMDQALDALRALRIHEAVVALVAAPVDVVGRFPVAGAISLLPVLALWGVLGGAVARSAAVRFATGVRLSWPAALGQALSLWSSLVMVLVGPVLVVGALVAVLAGAGKLLLDKPQASLAHGAIALVAIVGVAIVVGALRKKVRAKSLLAAGGIGLALAGLLLLGKPAAAYVGGALYGAALAIGVLSVALAGLSLAGLPMLAASVVCEGTDAVDGVQRVWAYGVAHPLRLGWWLVTLAGLLSVLLLLASLVVFGALHTTAWGVTRFVDAQYASALREFATHGQPAVSGRDGAPLTDWQAGSGALMAFWAKVLMLMLPALVVSFVHCAGSVLYLLMRQLSDGQDPADLWEPSNARRVAQAAIDDSGDEQED